jgi:hypothetical protein
VPGAVELQEILEFAEWNSLVGDPIAFAPHLKASTLPGVPIKPVLFQFAWGDLQVPNPANSALIRAANLRETSWMYRHDVARAAVPQLPRDPHGFGLTFLLSPAPQALFIVLAAHTQAATFFATDGRMMIDPNAVVRTAFGNRTIFEVPAFLPETLNF